MAPEHSSTDQAEGQTSNPRRLLRAGVIVPATVVFIFLGGLLLLFVPEFLLENWLGDRAVDSTLVRLSLGNAAQIVLFSLGGLIALVGVGLSLSRHGLEIETAKDERDKEDRRIRELIQQREIETERELRSRFASAVALLSESEKSTTREAGVYALAALADDWDVFGRRDERQVCIDVLCSYLRSSWEPAGPTAASERNIRAAGFDVIGAHLRLGTGRPTWHGARINLRGALIDFDANLAGISTTETYLDFTDATFGGGKVNFESAHFAHNLSFQGATVVGSNVSFVEAVFSGEEIDFEDAEFSSGIVTFARGIFESDLVSFAGATLSGASVSFNAARFVSGTVSFNSALLAGGRLHFRRTKFSGAKVNFEDMEISGTNVSYYQSEFTGGVVSFSDSSVQGGSASFAGTKFSGTVDEDGKLLTRPTLERLLNGREVASTESADVPL